MKIGNLSRRSMLPLLFSVVASSPLAARAQTEPAAGPPKVLVIQREFLKPGKDGSVHEKSESAFVRAMSEAKSNSHYFAMTSLSGMPRALFFSGYSSFAAWEADRRAVDSNSTLSAALDRANIADGDLLTSSEQSVWTRRDDMSVNPTGPGGWHYFELSLFTVRPGHRAEWEALVKLVVDGYKKGIPDAHFVMFEEAYGTPGGEFLVISALKSLSEVDRNFANGKQFAEAMGESGMKKMGELESSCVESTQSNLFAIDPKMSYPDDGLIQTDPTFWKPKVTAPARKPAAQ